MFWDLFFITLKVYFNKKNMKSLFYFKKNSLYSEHIPVWGYNLAYTVYNSLYKIQSNFMGRWKMSEQDERQRL